MTPILFGLLTFAFTLGFFGCLYMALERANEREPETLPSLPEVLERMTAPARPWISKEAAKCCQAKALDDGRPVIGYCGPDCERRPK